MRQKHATKNVYNFLRKMTGISSYIIDSNVLNNEDISTIKRLKMVSFMSKIKSNK